MSQPPTTPPAGPAEGHAARPPVQDAPAWRREPYRLFFPLGLLLAWGGMFHWIVLATGQGTHFETPFHESVFHSIAQVQGFLMTFAVGFLFTAIPRRTGTAAPGPVEMVLGLACPVLTTVLAWRGDFGGSQTPWLVLFVVVLQFAWRRFHDPRALRRPPRSFLWVPLALWTGFAGVALLAAYGMTSKDKATSEVFAPWVHYLGQVLLLQGMFLGLVVGVGGMVLPLLTRGDSSTDAAGANRWQVPLHLLAFALLIGSFLLEVATPGEDAPELVQALCGRRPAYVLRAAVVLALLCGTGRIWRRPSKPGAHRWLVWLSAWAIPVGYLLGALLPPASFQAGLHVVFIGGFALMALAVGLHISLAHGGRPDLVAGPNREVPVLAALLLAAIVLRALKSLDVPRQYLWLGLSAGCFLLATLVWLALVTKPLRRPPPGDAGAAG
ncbi:MAG: NnrS family protein [Planctomycetota bacterium]